MVPWVLILVVFPDKGVQLCPSFLLIATQLSLQQCLPRLLYKQ